jgi:hypothetical protein
LFIYINSNHKLTLNPKMKQRDEFIVWMSDEGQCKSWGSSQTIKETKKKNHLLARRLE